LPNRLLEALPARSKPLMRLAEISIGSTSDFRLAALWAVSLCAGRCATAGQVCTAIAASAVTAANASNRPPHDRSRDADFLCAGDWAKSSASIQASAAAPSAERTVVSASGGNLWALLEQLMVDRLQHALMENADLVFEFGYRERQALDRGR